MSDHTTRRLRDLVALAALSACAVPMPPEGTNPDDGTLPTTFDWPPGPTWDAGSCGETDWAPLSGLSTPASWDYLRYDRTTVDGGRFVGDERGTACKGAPSETTCLDDLAALDAEDFGGPRVVATDGGAVRSFATREDILTLLGAIDTPDEALLYVDMLLGWAGSCVVERDNAVRADGDAFEVIWSDYTSTCSPVVQVRYATRVDADGTLTHLAGQESGRQPGVCIGRRPPGLRRLTPQGATLGRALAHHAALEAASVHAFEQLAIELQRLGAPRAFVADAHRAAADERRHAKQVARLARRHGGLVEAPQVTPTAPRGLTAVALDNATEGCVRETWGAVIGGWQAGAADDPAVRRAFARIAREEAAHAALSWRLHRWLTQRLTPDARQHVARAQHATLSEVREDVRRTPSAAQRALGTPGPVQAERLLATLQRSVPLA